MDHVAFPVPSDPFSSPVARLIMFYLPQFHPIPENGAWWGAGFTEWTNVAKTRPVYRRHIQPRLPADLGFYDLRVPETREAQADMARAAGVEGFCYWHYWFGNGRRILERPFEEVLDTRRPNFPFCLAWANQSWTGIWHGSPGSVLMEQTYPGRKDEAAHFAWALRAFEDPRYIRVDGKPIFVIFTPHDLLQLAAFLGHWRELAYHVGLPGLFFVAITNRYQGGVARYGTPLLQHFDTVTPLVPQEYLEDRPKMVLARTARCLRTRNLGPRFASATGNRLFLPARYPSRAWWNTRCTTRGTCPACCRAGTTPHGPAPAAWCSRARPPSCSGSTCKRRWTGWPPGRRSRPSCSWKAWNEWAEGNYLEPDAAAGHAYLDATRRAILPTCTPALEVAQ